MSFNGSLIIKLFISNYSNKLGVYYTTNDSVNTLLIIIREFKSNNIPYGTNIFNDPFEKRN